MKWITHLGAWIAFDGDELRPATKCEASHECCRFALWPAVSDVLPNFADPPPTLRTVTLDRRVFAATHPDDSTKRAVVAVYAIDAETAHRAAVAVLAFGAGDWRDRATTADDLEASIAKVEPRDLRERVDRLMSEWRDRGWLETGSATARKEGTTMNIQGLDKGAILAALYNASKPQGLGALFASSETMTAQQAHALLDANGTRFDYLRGRVMKVDVGPDDLWLGLYDRDNGDGAGERAIRAALKL